MVLTVVALLVGGAVLLAVGLAILPWVLWCAVAIAVLASVVVGGHHPRRWWRSPVERDVHAARSRWKRSDWSGPLVAGLTRRAPGRGWAWLASPPGGYRPSWDERVVLGCTLTEVAEHLRGPDELAGWFPGVRRVHHDAGTDVLVGERGMTRLRVFAETWVPDAGGAVEADADGAIITAHVTMRSVIAPAEHPGRERLGVELWIHAESDDSPPAHRALHRMRTVTKAGLRHMEAELSRT
jgi:hypothetical protein